MKTVFYLFAFFILLSPLSAVCENTFKTRYATVHYYDYDLLEDFNDNLRLTEELKFYLSKKKNVTLIDEVKNKIDIVVEKVETVLEMFPEKIAFTLFLLPDEDYVHEVYFKKYKKKRELVGFFSTKTFEIYISVDDTNLKVFAHELGHMIVESYFQISPPEKMHELLAQFAGSRVYK